MHSTTILLDVSSSMSTPVTGGHRRIDQLSTILSNVVTPGVNLIAFSDMILVLEPGRPLPEPSGSTAMHVALDHVLQSSPRNLIVISDGAPDDARAALASARALNCVISTFYCGDESDRSAIAFMKQLSLCSRGGVGRPQLANLKKPEKLTGDLRLLLSGPVL